MTEAHAQKQDKLSDEPVATEADHAFLSGRPPLLGLSAKLLFLTAFFVLLAEVLIFVPSAANFRNTWLEDRISSARIAVWALSAAPEGMIAPDLEATLLQSVGVKAISSKQDEKRLLLTDGTTHWDEVQVVDLQQMQPLMAIGQTLRILFSPRDDGYVRAIDEGKMVGDTIEILVPEIALRSDLLIYSRNITILSLIISLFSAALVYIALHYLLVRPVRRLTGNMMDFAKSPEEAKRLIPLSGRKDEIGLAERELLSMQKQLQSLLRQKNNLANLGLAVSKISHDLRNMIGGAQLVADRLALVKDPIVERFSPRMMSSLDRALQLCETTLKYGRASERDPERTRLNLQELVDEVFDLLSPDDLPDVALQNMVSPDVDVDADREQLYRVLLNLCRNSVQALRESEGEKSLTVLARREGTVARIEVRDTGPGVPQALKDTLFQPYHNAKKDGIGLGLAIAYELVNAHGGEIVLADTSIGAVFMISLPDRVVELKGRRLSLGG